MFIKSCVLIVKISALYAKYEYMLPSSRSM